MGSASPEQRDVDLHLHTTWSDGRWSPGQVVAEAAARGLAAISITDHDVLGGLREGHQMAAAAGVKVLDGVELTADWDGRTVHILGHGIDPGHPALTAALERGRSLMGEHVERVLAALEAVGEPLSAADLGRYRSRYPGGAALVLAMVQRGVLRRVSDGLPLLRLAAAEPRAYTAREAIRLIHRAGGVASLGHPVKIHRDRPLLTIGELEPLVDAGLDGIEVWHVVHGPAERGHYAVVAEALGLLAVGGSDCHGPDRTAGPRIGSQGVPYSAFDRLSASIVARRVANGVRA